MNSLGNQKGMSLVEVLVSSMVSMVLGGVIYTVFFMYNNQASSTISSFLMQQQYDNVSRQIAQDVHRASFVLGSGETPTSFSAGFDTVTSIAMCNSNGVVFAQYAINGSQLTEGSQQTPYQAGGSAIRVVTGASKFILDPQRRSVSINLSLCKSDLGTTHAISARRDVFQCRNR
jgi:Tfp pilus assembly protein PilW